MNIYLLGLLWVAVSVIVATVLMIVIRRLVSHERRESGDDAAERVFIIVAGLQAVMVAFVLITLLGNVDTAKSNINQEANSLVAVYWAADSLPPQTKAEIQDLAKSYANTVANTEWPLMQQGHDVGEAGWTELNQMQQDLASINLTAPWLQDRQTEAANQLWTVFQSRQQRLDEAASNVNPILWIALVIGSALSVGITCLFAGRRVVTHLIMAAALAGTLGVMLFAISELQNPFAGGASIGPDAFAAALSRFAG